MNCPISSTCFGEREEKYREEGRSRAVVTAPLPEKGGTRCRVSSRGRRSRMYIIRNARVNK
jgi:hypothetical protein